MEPTSRCLGGERATSIDIGVDTIEVELAQEKDAQSKLCVVFGRPKTDADKARADP